jgi:hypothetical protein
VLLSGHSASQRVVDLASSNGEIVTIVAMLNKVHSIHDHHQQDLRRDPGIASVLRVAGDCIIALATNNSREGGTKALVDFLLDVFC